MSYSIGAISNFQKYFRGAFKTHVKDRGSRPFCWYFLLVIERQTFTANFAIPNEGIEQMTRKNDGACAKPKQVASS
jgi:hypothetical protein